MASDPTKFEEQIERLKSRGLIISDEARAMECLRHANYFRLWGFTTPLLEAPKQSKNFRIGARFEELWAIYCFDRELRILLHEAIERFETSLRTQWAYHIAHTYGPKGYERTNVFKNAIEHGNLMEELERDLLKSKEPFMREFRDHSGRLIEWPPVWVVAELMSFRRLSSFYRELARRQDRKSIADTYGLEETTLGSFVHHLVVIRNCCAHHSRLWNLVTSVPPEIPKNKPVGLAINFNTRALGYTYNTLVMLAYLTDLLDVAGAWKYRLLRLIENCKTYNVKSGMGFPVGWRNLPIWRDWQPDYEI